jgi:hypothetical protein
MSLVWTVAALCAAGSFGQTDIGSASSAGSVTPNQSLASMTPAKRLQLQEAQLSDQLKKFEAHSRQTSPSSLGLSDSERQSIQNAYDAFRKAGHEISPFDFLATTIALQALPPGNLPNKNATAIRAQLEANGIKNANIALFSEVVGGGGQPPTKSISNQYKNSLNKSRDELRKALK